ncbi:1-acyl-sn-glycerol-3-phosphate acyltransferase [Flavobacterium sp.]|uniref:1-acyl-sn-glycerol-3-phosphate acyltransferase n=1 Tax=Flavobacterium sp. TaxID=239 RepID=UPI0037502AA0
MKKWLYKFIFFKVMGWKIVGTIDKSTMKCVLMVMPHTSWHDFYLGFFTRGITQIPMHYIAKKELFKFPFGWYFRYMGGKPIDRVGNLNKVDAIAKIFETNNELRLAIMPEGTRKKVTEIKSGFYFIALKANVPIIPVAFDFGKKQVSIGNELKPSGNYEEDLKILLKHFSGVKGKVSENDFKVN